MELSLMCYFLPSSRCYNFLRMRELRYIGVITIMASIACNKNAPPIPAKQITASELPKITIRADSKMLYTFVKGGGNFQTVGKMTEIPENRRGWVRVLDLKMKPKKRQDHELVYVADLRQPGKDKTFPYVVMSRKAFEAATLNRVRQGALSDPKPVPKGAPGKADVILYSTKWCSACRSAKAYLKEKGISFVEKDIEEDSEAAAELLSKAKQAGISASGVPVLDVGGTLIQGFDPQRIHSLLGDNT
jgi:glutaredoxin-like YruB-family protein